jgi:anaerobic ribonucleoside-triphosphate reductase activating protein
MMERELPTQLRIFRRQSPVRVLGPHQRAVIWVQGCEWACPGCIVPESWSATTGQVVSLTELAAWVLAQSDIEGITLSGGEPLLQAPALTELIDQLRRERDLGVVCYTGYRLKDLQQRGTDAQRQLLSRIDLLIDGRYQAAQHDNLLWRGSRNQQLRLLTPRYATDLEKYLSQGDRSAGLEFLTNTEQEITFTGVPERANFRQQFEAALQAKGISVGV